MLNATINAQIRRTIRENGARLVSIEAVAKCGTIKRFVFSDAARARHIAPIVTASGAQAAETRARDNPDLINVWDINERRWRSFDVNRVLSITANKRTQVLRHYRPRVFGVAA